MGRRRKNRTHLKGPAMQSAGSAEGVPKSFIIKHGQVGRSITQLVRDFRKVMEPNTASRLRERNRNKLKDYLTIAPTVHVTHLLAFTLTPIAPSLRIVRLPAGPTLNFRVERYTLVKDILASSRHAKSVGMEYLSPPLLVLASFPPADSGPPHLSLVMKTFQSLFPPLSPKTISLSSARRVVLVAYNEERGTVDIRHYIITVKAHGVSRRVRRILDPTSSKTKEFVDLGREKDVAGFLLRQPGTLGPDGEGYETAASTTDRESVVGDNANAVDLADDYVGRNNKKGQRRAVRLDEVGPRMELRLIKITEGIPGKEGNVIYHEFVKKSRKETTAQKVAHAEKERLRRQRREEQERNVERKKTEAAAKKQNKHKTGQEDNEDSEKEEDKSWSEDEDRSDDNAGLEDDSWGEEEEVSEGDETDEDSDSDEADQPPPKRPRLSKSKM
ncbi:Brix-domain-containing protein [Fistulina hepatica ATCC 64428]|nr:Brix-domain-containing protein [Fistulina hepatica ATCC 64428]